MIVIEKWSGIITNASPYSLPGGACVSQTNIQCLRPGQIQVRNGLTAAATGLTGQVVAAVRYPTGSAERVLVHNGTSISMVTV